MIGLDLKFCGARLTESIFNQALFRVRRFREDVEKPDQAKLSPTQLSYVFLPSLAKNSLAELTFIFLSCYQLMTVDMKKNVNEILFMSLT